ncbi:MAG: methylmalonyl-CoA mutase family protein [Caldilinea sp.]|uniref:acyl-CoA mutase large subunit family protein n=1 Tax=Caldilinea sp. TaxID=2293560 RepID=UPI002CC1F90E|nr:methylmalonyl-CoA mutase family protein [Caldilinea sp.]
MQLYNDKSLDEVTGQLSAWEADALRKSLERYPERYPEFTTLSGMPIARLYTHDDVASADYARDLGLPGEYPYTRGVHATGPRGRLWTMRMFAGFGAAEETNQRFKYLLQQGQTGLSIAFDMPTLYGYDTDAPEAEGEFGLCGVACSSLADMEVLLDGLPLESITTSMTINSPAAMIWAMYIAAAEKRGVSRAKLGGTLQNDILKEYIAQKEFIFPPRPSMRLVTDTVEFAARQMPLWNPISVSGYHIREAGSTAVQELAFTLADGFEYVRWAIARGLDVDDFAPRISFFFNAHNDFFEEIAKYRAARRIWAREMKETFGAKTPRSWMLRFHTQTAGVSLTAQQPLNNVARVALQALAAVLGGTQSLHTNSLDEALALPSEEAVTVALRTQQIIAHESGVTNTVDPLGGAFFVEALTDEVERQAYAYFRQIEEHGGVLPALEEGFFQREITEAAVRFQREVESRRRVIVGVTDFMSDAPQQSVPLLRIDEAGYHRQLERLRSVRRARDNRAVSQRLLDLARAARREDANLMAPLLAAVNEYATLQEMMDVLREAWGVYEEPVIL